MEKVLIVYYSRTGNTQRIADEIGAACECTVEPLRDARSRAGLFGYLRSGREAWRKLGTDIYPTRENPLEYDVVALGTPVWAGNIASPVRTYLMQQATKLPRVAFFCTQGGAGAEKVFRDMGTICGTKPIATLVVSEKDLKAGSYRDRLAKFAGALRGGVASAPRSSKEPGDARAVVDSLDCVGE